MEKIEFFEKMTNTLLAYKLVVQEITLVIGVFGNFIALIVILSSTKFQTLTGFYLLNLSIADLLILSTSLFFSLYLSQVNIFSLIYINFKIRTSMSFIFSSKFKFLDFDKPAHYVSEWIFQSSVIVSTSIVTAFTVERYLAICHPFFVNSLPKKSRVRKIILTIWLIAVSLAVLPVAQLIIQINELVPLAPNNPVLIENQHFWPYISTFWAIFYFFVPMAVITVLYILIWLKLRDSSKDKSIIGSRANRADTRTLAMFGQFFYILYIYHAKRVYLLYF